ncbi:PREDICTED: probable LRR receptor-like serine/threonine-protein kinase At1g51810 [Theobroma cacao]|uniref:Probable LRR receptor-like serine/threonine-protein kinase At1g51810 n=1 Tax=Theobroma cacao TaxID=3641 RepID=A0AB32UT42_THECC|nr:PREDICTED: probable LRR receptor-like serine/threonine-protein kinase At1g51810 [Theobroma cacao]
MAATGTSEWVRTDCGSGASYSDESGFWQADEDFIRTGENYVVSLNSLTLLIQQFTTLRAFTEQNKNCYSLPNTTSIRYFIRATFLYGNYDGLSNPPTFDLEFNGSKWATVVTDTSTISYYEMIYVAKGDTTSICLARTHDKQFPFITLLKSWPVPDKIYAQMTTDRAWFNGYRYNYGAAPEEWILEYPVDTHNREWKPMTPPGSVAITATFASLTATTANDSPVLAIIQAVQALSPSDRIELPFTFSKTNHLNHVELYFTESLDTTVTRSFNKRE